ncbi:uncharacterized protein LOC113351837 [Papaver somniferum]|uniref:uncharacterized protein LOC113351837 n=1 Tax=Papaver somniferum TaxID=3469 RepID=UPI000E705F3B|nr:uncharacterized protein LOC113351837 [Papaver somniferum]
MVIHNSVLNKKGNIWLFWNKHLPTPTVISMSTQMITVNIGGNLISGIHAHVGAVQRRNLGSEMEGDPAFVFQSKLKILKKVLVDWNWRMFGNVHEQIKEAPKEVQEAMKLSDENPSNEELLENLVKAENKLNSKEVQLSTMYKLKARTKWVKEDSLLDVIPSLITSEDQEMLDVIPSREEIKNIIFEMDPDSSPGPDGFSGSFYRACWMIIQDDVVNAVQFCWKRRFIPKGLNSNFLVLLPKVEGARSPQQYRPIGLSNKRRNGNIGLKLDISQAYDSISWNFLFQVLKKYGFSDSWCKWLSILFESARISLMINGGPNGFFSVGRGLRQGDQLSPLLFVLMEDVLSRNITKMVTEDDVFVFCNGAKKSIQNLMKLLEVYQDSSVQVINKSKSKLFVDGTTAARKLLIKEIMQMEINSLPDKYLGVILHAGIVKIATVWPMVELMQKKLARWKGKLMAFHDRLVLIKSVLCGIPIYSMSIYLWPNEGGLGLQRLEIINKSLLMKILWRIINSEDEWALFIKAKFQDKHHQWKSNWQMSSIWTGLKGVWNHLKENIRWCLGNGKKISFWFDSWLGDIKGNFSTSSAVNLIRYKEQPLQHYTKIWNSYLHPTIASKIWKLIQGVYVDDSVMVKRGYELASRCFFRFQIPNSFEDVWSIAKSKSPFIKECWIIAACAILRDLWFQKNRMWFEQIKPNMQSFKAIIKKTIYERSLIIKSNKCNSDIDTQVILYFNLEPRRIKFQSIKMCHWIPPSLGFIMFCCDGASVGNPGCAGFGVVIRDHLCQVLGVITGGIGVATNYLAEVYAVINAVELAVSWGLQNIIICSDYKTVITEFENNKVPWFVRMIWNKARNHIHEIHFLHNYREINFVADTAAKKGAKMSAGQRLVYTGRPIFLTRVEYPNVDYYRIC